MVFPLVSRSTFTDDKETTRRYIQVTSRYSLMFAMAIAVVMAANPDDMLGLLYAPDYAHAGGAALGAPRARQRRVLDRSRSPARSSTAPASTRDAIVTAAITLVLAAVGNYIAIPMAAESGRVLEVAAGVTGGAMVIGAVLVGVGAASPPRRVPAAAQPRADRASRRPRRSSRSVLVLPSTAS